jgi:hypothetical protein
MKLFDYKFLIIFALSFVVYFIYKEIEYLRCKILSIEKNMLTEQVHHLKEPVALFKEVVTPKKINVDLSYNTVVSESETSISSRHVAIYSNDNLEHQEELEVEEELKSEEKSEEKEEKEEKNEYTKESLSKLTLDGLRTIAKDKNISLTKENGKQKIKKELIDNILE